MNVAFDPWIPVVNSDGRRVLISLSDIFTNGHEYPDLCVRPHERVSLMRLFICVAHASLNGPKNYDEWLKVPELLPDAAKKYLEKWKDSFELFHPEKPWLQIGQLGFIDGKDNDWSSSSCLSIEEPSGSTPTLFNSSVFSDEIVKDSKLALDLLTYQNFFVAGGKACSRMWGDKEMLSPKNPKGGPCSGKSLIFSFISSTHLIKSIYLNINSFQDLSQEYNLSADYSLLGAPLWEKQIKDQSDEANIKNATLTHIGRLVPITRMLKICPESKKVILGPGFYYPKFQDDNFNADIFATKVLKKNKVELLSCREDKSIWRDLPSILVKIKAEKYSRGPLPLLNLTSNDKFNLYSLALVTNPQQAAELVSLVSSLYSLSGKLLNEEYNQIFKDEVEATDQMFLRLKDAVSEYKNKMDGGWGSKLGRSFHVHFWTAIEINLPQLFLYINSIGEDDAEENYRKWRKILYISALNSYSLVCAKETPRQIKAFVLGYKKLTSSYSMKSKSKKEEDVILDGENI